MTVSIKLLPCDYDGRGLAADPYTFPVLLTAYDEDELVTAWRLKVTSPDKASHTIDLGTPNTHYATTIYNYDPYADGSTLLQGTYTFQLEAVATETVRSELVSMDILKEPDWDPMAGVDFSTVTQAADIAEYRWERQMISGLDFVAGDFIETDMDIHRCEFKEATGAEPSGDTNLGMDILFSIGLNGIDWVPWVFNVDFPAESNGDEGLYLNPTWLNGTATRSAGYLYCYPDREIPAHFRLESGGAYWNGQKIDVSKWGPNQN